MFRMSDKRFLLDKLEKGNAILSVKITDSVSNDNYFIMTKEVYEDDIDELVDLLNEQQSTITHLEKVNGKNFAKRRLLEQDNLVLRNENEQLKQEIKQYWKCRDKWKQEAKELKKENEQLKKQLDKGCKSLSENEIRQAYAELNRKEKEKHSSGNTTFTATLPNNEVVY